MLLPLLAIAALLEIISGNALATELVFVGSGFLALLFGGALFLLLLPFDGDTSVLLRKTLGIMLPLLLLLWLPWGAVIAIIAGILMIYILFPKWQSIHEETVRIEPIFFLLVGVKIVLVFIILLGY